MLRQGLNPNHWASQLRLGQVITGKTVERTASGYKVTLETPQRLQGVMMTTDHIKIGQNVLLRLSGYSNGLPVLTQVWACVA